MDAFASAGLADCATYEDPDGRAHACRVIVDQGTHELGELGGKVVAVKTTITLLKAEIPNPSAGAVIAIGDERHELDQLIDEDESRTVWTAVNG